MELADLSELDFASWKNPWADLDDEAPDRDPERDGVLTLRRLLETVAGFERRVELAIETKHPTRYAGLVERKLVEILKEFGWHEGEAPVRVMSFSYVALQRVQRLAPELALVMLVEHARHWPVLRPLVDEDWAVGPGIGTMRRHPAFARRLADSGRELHVWTVNTEDDLHLCLDLGVRAVITDRPRFVIDLLDSDPETPVRPHRGGR
jgi:glycerophosphoryl diester phosphodiesterase